MYNKLKFWMPSAVFFIVLFCSTISVHGQVYKNPDVNRSSTMDTKITAVENTFFYTQVNFTFTSPSSGGGCWLAAPDSKEAMYLQVGTKKYKLLSTNGIANEKFPGTRVKKGEKLEFYARFQKLPDDVKSFDLIEGASGNWSFYGVQLGHTAKKDNTSSSSSSAATQNKQEARERFKRDYNKIILYDGETEKWQDAIESYNSFVFNVNSNGDFISYFDGGEKNECRRISDVENHTNDDGDEYQVMKFLDEAGEEMVLFLYSEDLMVVDYNTGNAILFTKNDLEIIEEEGLEIIYDDEEFTSEDLKFTPDDIVLGVELDDLPKSNEDKYLMLIQKDGKYIFTNGGSKEYSFGSAYNFSQKVTKDNILSFAGKSISFKWKYQNSYDKKNGVADVTLYIYQRPGSYYVRGVIIAGEDKINVNGSVILK